MNLLSRINLLLLLLLAPTLVARVSDKIAPLHRGQLDLETWKGSAPFVVHGEWLVLPDQHLDAANIKRMDLSQAFKDPKAHFAPSAALFQATHLPEVKGVHAAFVMKVENWAPRSLGIEVEGFRNDFEANVYVSGSILYPQRPFCVKTKKSWKSPRRQSTIPISSVFSSICTP